MKGRYSRSAFDSRLLGIINEPGQIFRSAADAIDYQFGFRVSQTWFYQLLEKAIVPLILFAAITLYLLSCFVVVAPNEEAVIEHFGNPLDRAGNCRLAGPGLTLKWPWPIDIAYKYPTKKIMDLNIGFVPHIDPETGEIVPEHVLLWGKEHYEQEYRIIVATEHTAAGSGQGAVPVSLINANLPVQYKVKDLYSFLYNHDEPERALESICYRELARFAASAKVEVSDEAGLEQSLFGAGRARAKKILSGTIQAAADKAELGVEIVFVGIQAIHPPAEVAADYQRVIGAIQYKKAIILQADAEHNRILSTLAGSVPDADKLHNLVVEYQQAKENNQSEQIEKMEHDLDSAFEEARGSIFSTLRQAKSYAFEKQTLARATGERFADQLKAYRASKDFYMQQQRLSVFEEVLNNVRKYVVVADVNDIQVFIVDVEGKPTPSLYDISGLEENKSK